jgi:hypothetical protein
VALEGALQNQLLSHIVMEFKSGKGRVELDAEEIERVRLSGSC